MLKEIAEITHVVAVGSVDGVCTAAALLRLIGRRDVGLQFAQAFTVDKVDPNKWGAGRKVAFVDLAVNNRDVAMTAEFVRRIREAGHEIVAVVDEHSREDWRKALGSFDGLIIKPQSQGEGKYKSSGAVYNGLANLDSKIQERYSLNICDASSIITKRPRWHLLLSRGTKPLRN